MSDRKVGRVRRWNVLRSQIRHRGILLWLIHKIPPRIVNIDKQEPR